jgi:hypothetical protein
VSTALDLARLACLHAGGLDGSARVLTRVACAAMVRSEIGWSFTRLAGRDALLPKKNGGRAGVGAYLLFAPGTTVGVGRTLEPNLHAVTKPYCRQGCSRRALGLSSSNRSTVTFSGSRRTVCDSVSSRLRISRIRSTGPFLCLRTTIQYCPQNDLETNREGGNPDGANSYRLRGKLSPVPSGTARGGHWTSSLYIGSTLERSADPRSLREATTATCKRARGDRVGGVRVRLLVGLRHS